VNDHTGNRRDAPRDEDPRDIEQEIVSLRDDVGRLVGELDRRRHEAFDLRLQLRRHARLIALLGGAVVLLAGGLRLRTVLRRRRELPLDRARQLAHALALIGQRPDALVRVLEQPPQPAAVPILSGIGGGVAKALTSRLVAPVRR